MVVQIVRIGSDLLASTDDAKRAGSKSSAIMNKNSMCDKKLESIAINQSAGPNVATKKRPCPNGAKRIWRIQKSETLETRS